MAAIFGCRVSCEGAHNLISGTENVEAASLLRQIGHLVFMCRMAAIFTFMCRMAAIFAFMCRIAAIFAFVYRMDK